MRRFVFGSLAAAAAVLTVTSAQAALVFTEAMSSSGTTADWIEITNTGPGIEILTGAKVDDSSFATATARELFGVTSLGVGESAVFLESAPANAVADVSAFRSFWSGSPTGLTGVQIGTYSGSGIGLSGTDGDGLILYSAANAILAGPVAFPSSAGADAGKSFDAFNPNFHRSVVGQGGAFASAGGTVPDVGSPGTAVPEPAAAVLAATMLAVGIGCIRRK